MKTITTGHTVIRSLRRLSPEAREDAALLRTLGRQWRLWRDPAGWPLIPCRRGAHLFVQTRDRFGAYVPTGKPQKTIRLLVEAFPRLRVEQHGEDELTVSVPLVDGRALLNRLDGRYVSDARREKGRRLNAA